MRKIKKIQRRFYQCFQWIKTFFEDQWFYLKEFFKQVFFFVIKTIVTTAQLLTAAIVFAIIVLFADKIHERYIEQKVSNNVLFIQSAPDAKTQGRATGFEVKAKSGKIYTLTNAHVCELKNADNILMVQDKLHNNRFIPRRVIEIYEENDLCLVEGIEGYKGLSLGEEAQIGDKVFSIGYPLAQGLNITHGRIKGPILVEMAAPQIPLDKCIGERLKIKRIPVFFIFEADVCIRSYRSIATDVASFPGSSGSPLVDKWGNVVGVIFATNLMTHWGYAVEFKDVQRLLENY